MVFFDTLDRDLLPLSVRHSNLEQIIRKTYDFRRINTSTNDLSSDFDGLKMVLAQVVGEQWKVFRPRPRHKTVGLSWDRSSCQREQAETGKL